jgi:hypothetical protein
VELTLFQKESLIDKPQFPLFKRESFTCKHRKIQGLAHSCGRLIDKSPLEKFRCVHLTKSKLFTIYQEMVLYDAFHPLQQMCENNENKMTLRYLNMSDKMFSTIADRISSAYPEACILFIQELDNQKLLDAYNSRKLAMQLDEKTRKHVREELLFHGTRASVVKMICEQGFLCEKNVASGYGKGTYFSPCAAYSFPYMVNKSLQDYDEVLGTPVTFMILANVLLGRPCKFDTVDSSTLGTQKIDGEKYDHGVGMNGLEIVLSQDDAIYPRYIIAFEKKGNE